MSAAFQYCFEGEKRRSAGAAGVHSELEPRWAFKQVRNKRKIRIAIIDAPNISWSSEVKDTFIFVLSVNRNQETLSLLEL
jgi:hypothetical protein